MVIAAVDIFIYSASVTLNFSWRVWYLEGIFQFSYYIASEEVNRKGQSYHTFSISTLL